MIDFYLGRKSEIKKKFEASGFFQSENQILELKTICEKDGFKGYLEKLKKKFNLEIEFREIDETKYPVMIKFSYFEEEKRVAQEVIKELKKIMKMNNIKYYFIGEEIKSNNIFNKLIETMLNLRKKINEKEGTIKMLEKEIKQIDIIIKELKGNQIENKAKIIKLEEVKKLIEESIIKEKVKIKILKEQNELIKNLKKEKNKIEDKIKNIEKEKNEIENRIENLEKDKNKNHKEIEKLGKEIIEKEEKIRKRKTK